MGVYRVPRSALGPAEAVYTLADLEGAPLLGQHIGGPNDVLLSRVMDESGQSVQGFVPRIVDAASYRAYAAEALADINPGAVLHDRTERPTAYVSDGRWVADCDCGAGVSASRAWGLAICCACGSVYRPRFPATAAGIEQALLARPSPRQRHQRPGQTAADIARENAERKEVR